MLETSNKNQEIDSDSKLGYLTSSLAKQYYNLIEFSKEARVKLQDLSKTNFDLGLFHMRKGNISDAILRFKIVLFLKPDNLLAHYHLGRSLLAIGRKDQAEQHFLTCLNLDSNFAEASYMLSTINPNHPKPEAIPLSIIVDYYDELADFYEEEVIKNTNYRAPAVLFDALENTTDIVHLNALEVLELGCGNGYSGLYFKEKLKITHFKGIDISSGMLSYAKTRKLNERPLYDELEKIDINSFLASNNKKFNLIIACYSLHYYNSLAETLKNCAKSLQPGGILVFSVEKSATEDVCLNLTMRNFTLSKNYVEEMAKQAGFTITITEAAVSDKDIALQCICKLA